MRLIDADALKEWIENWFVKNWLYHPYAKSNNIPIPELYDILEQLPPAQPERKKGEWIQETKHYKDDEQEYYYYEEHCSNCGVKRKIGWGYASYCPDCGADMRGEPDE